MNDFFNNGLQQKEIRKKANNLLSTEIDNAAQTDNRFLCIIRDLQNQDDVGIDYQLELLGRDSNRSVATFSLQSKGASESITINGKGPGEGKISFSIDIKHVLYYQNYRPDAVIVTLADLKNQTVYWHPIQLDDEVGPAIAAAIKKNANQETITIYFDPLRRISGSNFQQLISDIVQSTETQGIRFNQNREKGLLPPLFPLTGRILDDAYYYFKDLYELLRYIPQELLSRNFPFSIQRKRPAPTAPFYMSTDNREFLELFSAVSRISNYEISITKPEKFNGVEDAKFKMESIMRWLSINHIYFIFMESPGREKAFPIFLASPGDTDPNAIGMLRRLDYVGLIKMLLDEPGAPVTSELAYLHYQLGNYYTAQKLLKTAAKMYPTGTLLQYITYYNRYQLRSRLPRYGELPDISDVLKEVESVPLEITYRQCLDDRQKAIIGWIHNSQYFTEYEFDIAKTVGEIKQYYELHLNHKWVHMLPVDRLQAEYGAFEGFITSNFLYYDQYEEFSEVTMVFIEGLLAANAIREGFGVRLKSFTDWMLEKIVLYANPKQLYELLYFYQTKDVEYKPSNSDVDNIQRVIDNLFAGSNELKALIEAFADSKNSVINFWNKYNNQLSNCILVAGFVDFGREFTSSMIDKVLFLFEHLKSVYPRQSMYFSMFASRNAQYFTSNSFRQFFLLMISGDRWSDREMFETFYQVGTSAKLKLVLNNEQELLANQFFFSPQQNNETYSLRIISATIVVEFISAEHTRKKWLEKIKTSLKTEFVDEAYRLLALSDLIPFDEAMFNQYKQIVYSYCARDDWQNAQWKARGEIVIREHGDFELGEQRFYLDLFLDLVFKYNVALTKAEQQRIRAISEYYDFLIDPARFNYSRFQPRWITRFASSIFMDYFRKFPQIKKELEVHLSNNSDKVILQAYFTLYSSTKTM